ncbi:hypothetical protein [Pseudomonas sp. GM55]|uniref:hypothetical protein n=1 Tax=Pseudomonas sp. GM55 TaxID=1144333 RepID=UPI00027067D1|nr:hypothetical protein [Pseudomonas sp. GM55]EJM69726.1 hypothetical protein PMI31_04611 [Pseudomonas sp. GM55]
MNPSYPAIYKKVSLTFGPLPANLNAPQVPQAVPGPLNMEHVSQGVSVWMDTYDNPKGGDIVRVKWGGQVLSDYIVGENPPPRLEIPVLPALLMLQDYGENTTGDKSTTVSYEVIRKGRVFGPESDTFDVNFETPIPWVPWPPVDWPDPVHPNLIEGEVENHDGTRTNQLTRADKDEDATFTFTWYATAKNDDVIDFFWNGTRVVEAQVTFDDTKHKPGEDCTVPIDWECIKGGGNGNPVPVHYKLHRPGVENDLDSETTEVDVNAIAVEMPAASFPKITNPTGYPGCGALESDGSLTVRIPDLTGILKAGDTISFEFIPMIGDDLSAPENPIPGVKFEKDFKLGEAATPLTGFTFAVEPYATYIKPLYDQNPSRRGRAKIWYFFDDGTEKVPSAPLVTRTAFHGPSSECPITPAP